MNFIRKVKLRRLATAPLDAFFGVVEKAARKGWVKPTILFGEHIACLRMSLLVWQINPPPPTPEEDDAMHAKLASMGLPLPSRLHARLVARGVEIKCDGVVKSKWYSRS